MKSMKSVSKPLPNPFAVGAVILTCLILLAGCSEGGGGGRVEKICEDYCVHLHVDCGEVPRAKDLCLDECIQDVEEAEEIDGKVCSDAELNAFLCITDLNDCNDVFDFVALQAGPFPVCTAEISEAVCLCTDSIDLDCPGD
jgi:hypothetical protein